MITRKKIAVVDFGAKRILDADKSVERLVLGQVGGIITGVAKSNTATGDVLEGLRGAFRFFPTDGGEVIDAPVLWLPGDSGLPLLAAIKAENAPAEIHFVREVSAVRVDNDRGFDYDVQAVFDFTPNADKVADPVKAVFDAAKGSVDKAAKAK